MSACARSRQPTITRALREQLCEKEAPSANHYNALLVSCGVDAEAAAKVLQEIRDTGITPRISDWKAACHT